MANERHEVCVLLDKLTLEMLHLIEDNVRCQINIETSMNNANINLAKARYIMGQNNVSGVQLPSEGATDFSALTTVERDTIEESLVDENLSLSVRKSEPDSEYINPIKWFGVLVPQSLHQAQSMFAKTLTYIIELANIKNKLNATYDAIRNLKRVKAKLTPEE